MSSHLIFRSQLSKVNSQWSAQAAHRLTGEENDGDERDQQHVHENERHTGLALAPLWVQCTEPAAIEWIHRFVKK